MSDHENENENENKAMTPEERGVQIGAALDAAAQREAAEAATPAGQARDRKTHRGVIIAAVAFAVLLVGAGIAYNVLAPKADQAVEIGGTDVVHSTEGPAEGAADTGEGNGANGITTPAPDFSMTDAEGATVRLSDFKGRPVLLNFWASWCGPCKSEMPAIQEAWKQSGDEVAFVIVNMTGMDGESEEAARAFLTGNGYDFPCYFDKANSAAAAFGVSSIPQTYLINAEGNIIGGYMGAMDDAVLAEGLRMLTDATATAQ